MTVFWQIIVGNVVFSAVGGVVMAIVLYKRKPKLCDSCARVVRDWGDYVECHYCYEFVTDYNRKTRKCIYYEPKEDKDEQ